MLHEAANTLQVIGGLIVKQLFIGNYNSPVQTGRPEVALAVAQRPGRHAEGLVGPVGHRLLEVADNLLARLLGPG